MPKSNFKIDEITLVLIAAVIAIIFSISSKSSEPSKIEAERITAMLLDDHTISFANGGVIDENKLKGIQNMDYQDFKNSLKAKNDFCIYIEDENGNIILAKGSSKLNKDGIVCRE